MADVLYYSLFDFWVASTLELPELGEPASAVEKPAIRVSVAGKGPIAELDSFGRLHSVAEAGGSTFACARAGTHYLLRVSGLVDFVIDPHAGTVECYPCPEIEASTLRHLVLDQAIPRMIGQRGELCVHGAAVLHRGRALVFLGSSGFGKSTLAASFASVDEVMADDCVLLRPGAGLDGALVIGSYPGLRLWPEAMEAVGSGQATAPLAQYSPKCRIRRARGTSHELLPAAKVAGLFLLNDPDAEPSDDVDVSPQMGQLPLLALLRRSFVLARDDSGVSAQLFESAARLLRSGIEVYVLRYPRRMEVLPEVHAAILEATEARIATPVN